MAIGREPSERGGVIDPPDVRGAGPMEWEGVAGIPPSHPLIASGARGYNIEDAWNRVVTTPYGQAGPAADTIATPEGTATGLGHWSDVLNFHGSPLPWVLVILVVILFLSHLSLRAGAGGEFGFGG